MFGKNSKKKILFLWVVLISSCTSKSSLFDEIMGADTGHLRGVFIGASINDVKSKEDNDHLTDDEKDYLYYDYELDGNDSYTVSYDFYDGKLYQIEIAVFLAKIEEADKLFEAFKSHFDKKYGEHKQEDNYLIWETTEVKNKHHIEFALRNQSESYGYLTVIVTDLDY